MVITKKRKNVQVWSKQMGQNRKKRKKRSPAVPSISEQKTYEKFLKQALKNKKDPKVLILGVTPELRDIALKNNCQVVCIDISREMIKIMKPLIKYKGVKKEKIINANWLTVSFPKNSFDLVMGDGTLTNLLSIHDVRKLLFKIQRVLKPEGFFLIRELIHLSNKKAPFKKIVSDYRKNKIKWEDFFTDLRFYTFFNKAYNPKNKLLSADKIFQEIEKKYQQGELTKKEYQKIMSLENRMKNLVLFKGKFMKLIKENFSIISIKIDKEFRFSQYLPIYLLKNRK